MNGLTVSPLASGRSADAALLAALGESFGNVPGVSSALLLGSRSRGNDHPGSNADVLLILDRLDMATARGVSQAKSGAEKTLGCGVSVNVHIAGETDPSLGRWGLFMHQNRAEVFVFQAKYTSVTIFGGNAFSDFPDPPPKAVRKEAIRVTASFSYLLRKYLFNESLAPHGAAEFVRIPLIALEYISAFHSYISMGYQDGLGYLSRLGVLTGPDLGVLTECADRKATSRYDDVGFDLALRACGFLDRARATMVSAYRRRGVSDIRLTGGRCQPDWRLDLPQAAAMTIVRLGGEVLLLHRPPDDYLYPDRWTVPGGYLQRDESPADAAAREILEETGLRAMPAALFSGAPVVSDRLAAFAFTCDLPPSARPRLTEHDASMLVPCASALEMELTSEARQILERYYAPGPDR